MVTKKSWAEFREAGLLWFVNRLLHLLGWAIVLDVDDNGQVTAVYPARVRFRGFGEDIEAEGFTKLTEHIKENIGDLAEEANE